MIPGAVRSHSIALEPDGWPQEPATPPERVAPLTLFALLALALCVGFGDIASGSPATALVFSAVHALPLAVIGLAMLDLVAGRRRPRRGVGALALPVAVWLGLLVTSAALASTHRLDALAALGRPLTGVLLAWSVTRVCRRLDHWLLVCDALVVGILVVAALGLAEATGAPLIVAALRVVRDGDIPIGDVPRVAATLSHPNEAAMLLELGLPLLIAWAWTAARSRREMVLVAASAATLLALVQTFSRAGIFTTLLMLGLLALLAWRRARDRRRRLAVLAIIGLVVPIALGWTALVDPGLDRRLLAGLDESSAAQPPRTEFWNVALQMQQSSPLLGVGPDNFRWLFASYSGVAADNLGIHAHNQYLEALADTGVLGLVGLVWVLGALLVHSVRAVGRARGDWPWRAATLASLSAWLMHALLDDFERFWPTSVAFWLLAGLSVSRLSD